MRRIVSFVERYSGILRASAKFIVASAKPSIAGCVLNMPMATPPSPALNSCASVCVVVSPVRVSVVTRATEPSNDGGSSMSCAAYWSYVPWRATTMGFCHGVTVCVCVSLIGVVGMVDVP